MNGLSRLLDLGHLLQRRGIVVRFEPLPATTEDAPEIERAAGAGDEHGARRPWLLHAVMDDGIPAGPAAGAAVARLAAVILRTHARD